VRRGTSKSQLHQLGQGGNALGDGASDCVHRNLEEVGRVQLLARRDRSNVWANTATSLLLLLLLLVVVVVVAATATATVAAVAAAAAWQLQVAVVVARES